VLEIFLPKSIKIC